MCDFFSGQPRIDNDGCGESFIDPDLAYDIVNTYSLAFARYHRTDNDDAESLIDGDHKPFDPATLDFTVGAN
jgi:hypothetical protein